MHTGQQSPQSMINEYLSGKIVFDNSNNKCIFPALNVSNNFATIDYDDHINTKIDNTTNHVFRSMTIQELNTLHTVCDLERNQLLTILAMSVQNPQLAGFFLTGNRSNFLYVEGSTAWLYDCPHFLSPLYKADRCFDRIPIHLKDTLMYVDPITRQTYDYATPIACDNNPRNILTAIKYWVRLARTSQEAEFSSDVTVFTRMRQNGPMVMGACPGQIPMPCVPPSLIPAATMVRACCYISLKICTDL